MPTCKHMFPAMIYYFNTYKIGEPIFRKDFIKMFYGADDSKDTYRRYLCKAGYLKMVGLGRYMRVMFIDPKMTVQKLRKEAYGK